MTHHSKDKGDLGVGKVIADMMSCGVQPLLPISEHLPFDLVAVSPDGDCLRRIQVRYKTAVRNTIKIDTRSTWCNTRGLQKKSFDLTKIDAFAVYCPNTDCVYYINACELTGNVSQFDLRLIPTNNGQTKRVRMADEYADIMRIFARP